jgi:hypothetical protein
MSHGKQFFQELMDEHIYLPGVIGVIVTRGWAYQWMAEWNEYATRTAKDNSLRMKREREERLARNREAFNRDRLAVRA